MTTIVKTGSMVLLGLALTLGIKNSNAQEQTVKAADATEVVSAGKEVKTVMPVVASLAKAMVAAKTKGKKEAGKKIQTIESRYVSGVGTYSTAPVGIGCGEGTNYCGFSYDSQELNEADARAIAEAHYGEVDDGGEVQGVKIFKRSNVIWNP